MSARFGSEGWIRLLLRSYPSRYRARFGEGMEYTLVREAEAARGRGRGPGRWFWIRTTASLVWWGCVERLRVWSKLERSGAMEARKGKRTMGDVAHEVRHAVRRLSRTPGFTATALVTLGLGIGATTAMFSVVDAVLLRPLPYPDPDRLVVVGHVSRSGELGMPAAGWLHYRDRSRTISDFAIYLEVSSSLAGMGSPLELKIIRTTPNLLGVLGVRPALGRDFTEEDGQPGAPPVVLVSHGYWVRHLGSDPAAVGRPLMEGEEDIVAGVLPADFAFERPQALVVFGNPFDAPDIIVPIGVERAGQRFGNYMYHGVARLAPGVTTAGAERELRTLMMEAAEAYPGGFTPAELEEGGYRPRVERFRDAIVGNLASVLWILFGAVGFVLLIATANVANLFLVRAESRQHELAIRRALGASRGGLARTFLTESVLLALVGGVIGTVIAAAGTALLLQLAPAEIPRAAGVGLDFRVLAFASGLSILAGLLFGALPLVRGGARRRSGVLGETSRGGTAGVASSRTRRALVVTQVAFAVVLLVGSGLLLRTFRNLRNVDPGFDGSHTVTLRLALSGSLLRAAGRTERAADAARSRFMLDLAQRLEQVPGVARATFSADLPLDGGEFHDFVAIEGQLPTGLESATKALRTFVGPGYLDAIGARLITGRELEASEFLDQPRAVVVNRAFAESRFPDGRAVGSRVMQWAPGIDPTKDVWYTIVGIVENIRETSLMAEPEPTVYLPTIFLPEGDFAMWVSNMVAVVRVHGDAHAVLPRIREEIRAAHPEIPINAMATLEQVSARSFQEVSFAMTIVVIAAALALLLGLVGLYGTVAYVVGRRTREFGLRMALGASGWDVRRHVLAGGAVVGIAGIVFGLAASVLTARIAQSLLFGVSTTDPLVYAGVATLLFVLVLFASLGPAGRAAAADPADALRAE